MKIEFTKQSLIMSGILNALIGIPIIYYSTNIFLLISGWICLAATIVQLSIAFNSKKELE